jgi:chaperonin GroEL (HSP60 family)
MPRHATPRLRVQDIARLTCPLTLPSDPGANVGAKLIKAVANKSDKMAGDGTTTSTLMTQVLINKGYKLILTGGSV